MMKRFLVSCCLFVLIVPIGLCQSDEEAVAIAKKVDHLYRSDTAFADVVMEIETPHWKRSLEMRVWSEGMDKTFIRILSPRKERGVGTLRMSTEMWNYLPRTGKVIKIPPSMMMSAWMGSDFTNDDLVREFTLLKDYTFRLIHPENAVPDHKYLEAKPKPDIPIVWDRVVIEVRAEDLIPVSQRYYDERGEMMREMTFTEIRNFEGRQVPSVLTLVPAHKEGHKTVIRYRELKFDVAIDPGTFSLRHLRQPVEGDTP